MAEGTAIVICVSGVQATEQLQLTERRVTERRDNRGWPLYREAIHNLRG